jgi:hypothetical protein
MIYQYRCDHGHEFERVLPVEQYKDPQTCECGAGTTKILVPVQGYVDNFQAFRDASGSVIQSRREWNNHLYRNNLIETGKSDLASQQKIREKNVYSWTKSKERKERLIQEFNSRT